MNSRTKPPYGPLLAHLRERKGLTQDQLAALGGITRKAVSRYETGARNVPERRFASLCAVLGYTPPEVEAWLLAFRALPGEDLAAATAAPCLPGLPPELDRAARAAVAQVGEALGAEAAPRFGRAVQAAAWRRERQRGERLGRKLLAAPPAARRLLLAHSLLHRSWPVVEWLCHASVRAAARDPRLALRRAQAGLQAAEANDGPEATSLQGYAWAFVGNAQRVGNDLRGAERSFDRARRLWTEQQDQRSLPLAGWRLLDLEASLRRDQRRWAEALELLDQAAAQAPPQAQGRLLLNRAFVLEQIGEHHEALESLARAERLSGTEPDARLLFGLRFNQAVNLIALDRALEAEALLPEIQALVNESGKELDLLRTLWIRGRLASALSRPREACAVLSQVLAAFIEARLSYDSALAGLDLALVFLEQENREAVRELAEGLVWIFDDSAFAREGLAALRIFCEAARQSQATAALARTTWLTVKYQGNPFAVDRAA